MIRYLKINEILCFLIIITIILTNMGCDKSNPNKYDKLSKEIKDFNIPIYNNVQIYNMQTIENIPIKKATYEVKIFYPAKELIEFYDTKMINLGYKPFVEEYYKYADRQWQYYVDATMNGNPQLATYSTCWSDENRTLIAILLLQYYWPNKSDKVNLSMNNDLKVTFQIMPFVKIHPPESAHK